jgi:hypothetical protein
MHQRLSKHALPAGYPLSPHDERRVAVAAKVDPRSVRAWFTPARRARMRSTTRARIEETLRVLAFLSHNQNPERGNAA